MWYLFPKLYKAEQNETLFERTGWSVITVIMALCIITLRSHSVHSVSLYANIRMLPLASIVKYVYIALYATQWQMA